ncbi:Rap1a/Tai family immunity protein [Bradyrhizobium oligotrophicum]|uniref:Rap1a/Tai family immunity protein n=1 Tax=Bradyrhizobium oligotrophicum TaxID=44255 RepID=UPI003EBDB40E
MDLGIMRAMLAVGTILLAGTLQAFAGDVPKKPLFSEKTFFTGNDVYQWCQYDKASAQTYVGGMYDMSVHGAFAIDRMRHLGAEPDNGFEVDFALEEFVGFCMPERATLEQMTDVFCAHLRNKPAKRDWPPALMLKDALKDAWPCPGSK